MVRIGHSGCSPLTNSEQQKTITQKIETMIEDEATGSQTEVGTVERFLDFCKPGLVYWSGDLCCIWGFCYRMMLSLGV